ncbi:Asp23/Gls24 family envelope stress response protein [Mesoplasma chauliocola]|uniref:Asp23/Gls24 family envelope stress response protein n=1 Tax=Mesoplasma chauliocola TaxID=216427 RepID=A0A249SMR8_9MOLU|nr:Asp23/Gls24 family envelope stress response protein [Mesoplasma chauliocola]ASZ08984.1 Asp23/Gls24 family envelope stress response protein [Mesoplasma chauliocola]
MNTIDKSVIKVIKDAIVTVPGVVSFSNFNADSLEELATSDINNAIEFTNTDNITRFRIHVIILSGVNIKDVIKEIQIRVKYELEKISKFTMKYMVDVVVDDLA